MGSPYPSQGASGYNSSPPPDDGSVSAANKLTWAKIKTQIGDAVKGLADAINTALRTALNVTPTTQSSAYTTTAADHLRPIEVTGTTTISLGTAATMVAQSMGYEVPIVNVGTSTVTVNLITNTDALNGVTNGSVTIGPKGSARFAVNSTNNGYEVIAQSGVAFMGNGAGSVAPSGVANIQTTVVGNVGGGTDDLMTYSLPANSLSANGKAIRVTAWGAGANNANAKQVAFFFGSILSSVSLDTGVPVTWRFEAIVTRSTGSGAQKVTVFWYFNTGATGSANQRGSQVNTTAAVTDTAAITVKAQAVGVSDNDVTQEGMIVEFLN